MSATLTFACRNPACPERGHIIHVRAVQEYGRYFLADDQDIECRECGQEMVDPDDLSAPHADDLPPVRPRSASDSPARGASPTGVAHPFHGDELAAQARLRPRSGHVDVQPTRPPGIPDPDFPEAA